MLLKAINRTKGRPVKYIAFFTFCFYTQERKKAFILLSATVWDRNKSITGENRPIKSNHICTGKRRFPVGKSSRLAVLPLAFSRRESFLACSTGEIGAWRFRKKLFNILFTAPAADFSTPVFSPVSVIYRNNRKISLHFTAIWRKIVTYNLWGCSSAGRAYGSHP